MIQSRLLKLLRCILVVSAISLTVADSHYQYGSYFFSLKEPIHMEKRKKVGFQTTYLIHVGMLKNKKGQKK